MVAIAGWIWLTVRLYKKPIDITKTAAVPLDYKCSEGRFIMNVISEISQRSIIIVSCFITK